MQASALTPDDLERRYEFPPGDAAGQVVAIAEFGGAYFADDTAAYCAKYGRPVPQVTPISAGYPLLTKDQIRQLPQREQQQVLGESIEVMMDVEIIAGLCPGAQIPLYFAPFTEQGWVDLLNAVMTAQPMPVALSISWGLAEDAPDWSHSALMEINHRLHAAALMGITVCVASGDDGAGDQIFDGQAHVNYPASSRWVLAVGGTQLDGDTEVVWWESPGDRAHHGGSTGGGVSTIWGRPAWQDVQVASLNPGAMDGRVLPDVAAVAGAPFYDLIFLGQDSPNGGTSAATPVWAALLARVAAGLAADKQVRFLPPLLYAANADGAAVGSVACADITSGDNRSTGVATGYQATQGFDAVTGWGTPKGTMLQQQLSAL
jgi:kumamolisin